MYALASCTLPVGSGGDDGLLMPELQPSENHAGTITSVF